MNPSFPWYWISLPAVMLAAWIIFRGVVRRDYLQRGALSPISTALEFLVFGLHANLPYLYLAVPWPQFPPLPSSPIQRVLGIGTAALGLAATLAVMAQLGFRTTLGKRPKQFNLAGPYRWSRNPQLLAYGVMLLGCGILYPSWSAAAWLLLYGGIAQLMVRTEEEHLLNLFGGEYEAYCRSVPRYLPLPGRDWARRKDWRMD